MPVKIRKTRGNKVRVSTPSGVKSYATTLERALKQRGLLNAVEHSDWEPTKRKRK